MSAQVIGILVTGITIQLVFGQQQHCFQAYECANETTSEAYQTSSVNIYGYKGHYGVSSFIISTEKVYCQGAYSCSEASLIQAKFVWCAGALSCHQVSNIQVGTPPGVSTTWSSLITYGANALSYSTVSDADKRGIDCWGEQGCAHSIIRAPGDTISAWGAYSLLNTTIDSINGASTITIWFSGYFAGFGTNIICRTNQTCIINCNQPMGCAHLKLNCSNNCIINGIINDNISLHDALLYDSLTISQANDASCSSQVDAMTFDDYKERFEVLDVLNNTYGGPVCCRGVYSCLSNNIRYTSASPNDAIICSGYASCYGSQIYSNGPVFCSARSSCSGSSIITTGTTYCQADGSCRGAFISQSSPIYCAGAGQYPSCRQSFIESNGVDLDLYLTGYRSGQEATVHCSSSDHCSFFCYGFMACYNLKIVCDGTCTIHCDAHCPKNGTLNPSPAPTSTPTSATTIPTSAPSQPTFPPSLDPSSNPSPWPTVPPTAMPTTATNQPTMSPSFDPSSNPTAMPTTVTNQPTLIPSFEPSSNPTVSPTVPPTAIPTTATNPPTMSPSFDPSSNPTVFPILAPSAAFDVSFPGNGIPISAHSFLGDPYGRFQASIDIMIYDETNVLGINALCSECFIWQYRSMSDGEGVWIDIEPANSNDISVYNTHVITMNGTATYQSRLTIQSSRRLNAGHCFTPDSDNSRIFTPGNIYELRLQFTVDREYRVSSISNALSIETNSLPSGGVCVIQDLSNVEPLKPFHVLCDGWDNETHLEYNALHKDVWINRGSFVDNATELEGIAPVGNVSITIMIKQKDVDNAITCYDIDASFQTISGRSNATSNILSDIATITNTTSLSDHLDIAVSIFTVIQEMYDEELTTQDEAAYVVDAMVHNIVDGSGVLDIVINIRNNSDISWVVLDGDDLIAEMTTIAALTSNPDIVDANTTVTLLVETYLSQIFEAIDVFIATTDGDIQHYLYVIAQQCQELIENLESALAQLINTTDHEMMNHLNYLTQAMVDYATLAASKALSRSDVGESFVYKSAQNNKAIMARKFDANIIDFTDETITEKDLILPQCGHMQQMIELPLPFMKQHDGLFDCVFMASSKANFVSKQNRTQQSDTITINLYDDEQDNESRRRRLIEFESDACFPYLITMGLKDSYNNMDMSLDHESRFPSCDFWNVTDSLWDTAGCFVYNITNATVTCGCTHLTTFSVKDDHFIPEATIVTEIDWREFTFYNLYHYPTVWLTCASLFVVFVIICWINPLSSKINTRSILAFEDIIYKSVQEEKLWADIAGKEIKYITDHMPNQHLLGRGIAKVAPTSDAKKSICHLQLKLFAAYLRNDHSLLSVFQRSAGTNFSVKQRLGCFFMYLCTVMVTTGTFYGLEQSNPMQDIVASFVISLFGTAPTFIVKKMFEKAKPLEIRSTKHEHVADRSDETQISDTTDTNEGGRTTPVPSRASQTWDMKAFMAERGEVTISVFDAQIKKFYDQDNERHKIQAVSDIRKLLFDEMFPLPRAFKTIAWILLIIWSFLACATAIVYGFKFDLEAQQKPNADNSHFDLYQNEECWNTSLSLQIEMDLSKKQFLNDYVEQQAKNASSYGGSDARSWLFSVFESLITSLILWQPLTVYVVTWIKIWMFSWNLRMKVGPG
eukprot:986074_1